MRSIHEANRLLSAVCDSQEEEIVRRWLANKEVKQGDARAAEQRQASRLAHQLRAKGIEPEYEKVEQLSREIYRGMSKAAHHQRSVVDEAVDPKDRTMIYGADPSTNRQLAYTVYAGALVHEVSLLVGDALCVLWGPGFYRDHLVPLLRRFEEALAALDVVAFARRIGSA